MSTINTHFDSALKQDPEFLKYQEKKKQEAAKDLPTASSIAPAGDIQIAGAQHRRPLSETEKAAIAERLKELEATIDETQKESFGAKLKRKFWDAIACLKSFFSKIFCYCCKKKNDTASSTTGQNITLPKPDEKLPSPLTTKVFDIYKDIDL